MTQSIYKSPEGKAFIMKYYDEILDNWPVAKEEIYVPTRHGETFMIASGEKDAPPIILLHGSASNATSWIGDVAKLSEHFRVYAVDLPGEPNRSTENRPSWNNSDFADWLLDVCDELHIEKAIVAGISQGGWTTLKFATTYPQRVSKLVLLASGGITTVRASFMLRAIPLSFLGKKGAEMTNRITFGKEPISQKALEIMDVIMKNFNPRIEAQPNSTDEELAVLEMPVLYIGGQEDALFDSQKSAKRLIDHVENAEIILLPEVGHVVVSQAERIIEFAVNSDREQLEECKEESEYG